MNADAQPTLSFCVVNTNGARFLPACLDSIQREIAGLGVACEVLVLDNASVDESVAIIESHPVTAQLIKLDTRTGKAANDSLLLDSAAGEFALLINEDSELVEGACRTLLDALQQDPQAGCAGARLLDPEGVIQPSAWRFPGLLTALAQATFLHKSFVVQSSLDPNYLDTARVDWCQSACLMVRVKASEAVGHLDPEYFVYGDEVDLQKRLAENGWHSLHVAGAKCTHHEQLSTGPSAQRRIVELHRNHERYLVNHNGRLTALACRPLAAWPYLARTLAALVLPGHSAQRFWWHVKAALMPHQGEGLREAAERFNQQLGAGS